MRSYASVTPLTVGLLALMLILSSGILYSISTETDLPFDEDDINEVVDDFTSYIIVKEGYASFVGNELRIALLVKPIFDDPFSIENLSIQVVDKDSIDIMELQDVYLVKKNILSSAFWDELNQSFGIIPVIDRDNSIYENSIVNGDTFYLVFKVDDVNVGDEIEISLLSESGAISVITITIPFSTSTVFKVY